MRLFTDLAELPVELAPSAITVGKFDGVHRGHRWLLSRLVDEASSRGLEPVAVTFDRHPLSLITPGVEPEPITSLSQKIDLLAETGLGSTIVLPFDDTLAGMSPEAFVRDLLVGTLRMRLIVVGQDFRFGAKGAGDVALLRELAASCGFEIVIADDEMAEDERSHAERRASSTWVRELLAAGEVRAAAEVLGHNHTVTGEVVHGAKRGRELGFPTANLSPELEGLIPADGVYAGWFRGGDLSAPAAISIGNNPTFDGVPRKQVEAHLIGETVDLYGLMAHVEFVERIRGMEKFDSIDALKDRMALDVVEAAETLGGSYAV
ncbi:bifunctional riboflavin kinase/FAD synthetase [Pseudoclavibacter sp. RFBB5]|uniref:bifunctional riboflavin kinase/FAD synthetase n=1 Tax=Pseudoclavibacter sp. RFBB5 TaxID=2080574 RepID=UPI000CE83D83|nr:bifunctional riboflavin kinase/FAD synthetase [Pseudoclavibacter sp. RFBB5]PPG29555.1 bifunctional riboflavin kinase/FAD synthetase [Pseudoclavibacter sp. RFBB5]